MGLLLGAHEQQALAVLRQLTDEVVSLLQLLHGLLQVDDIDAVALGEDIGCHLGVPATGLVTEVHTCLQKLLHRYDCHRFVSSLIVLVGTSGALIRAANLVHRHTAVCLNPRTESVNILP